MGGRTVRQYVGAADTGSHPLDKTLGAAGCRADGVTKLGTALDAAITKEEVIETLHSPHPRIAERLGTQWLGVEMLKLVMWSVVGT